MAVFLTWKVESPMFYIYERLTQTLKNAIHLPSGIITSFQGSQTQFQSQRLVMLRTDVYVKADLCHAKWPAKPRKI